MASLLGGLFHRMSNRTPVPFTTRTPGILAGSLLDRGDLEAQMRAYSSVSTLFAIVSGLNEAEAQVNWRLYRKAASGKEEDREEVTQHAALALVRKPNDFYSWPEFVWSVSQHRELTGEEWWIVVRSGTRGRGIPLELWPVRPDRMTPIPDREKFLSHYIYTSPDGEKVRLELGEVIQVKLPNPLDPYRGMGPVQSLLADLDSSRYSAEWNRNFFLNGAEPGGIVEAQERLSDDEFDEFTSRWREQHQGVANAHRVALLERMKWVERKFSMRDMQFTELRGVSREIIREAFRYPKPLLGTTEDVNRANAIAAELMFARWLIAPRAERRKSVLNTRLLPMFGPQTTRDLEFDFDPVTPDDPETENAGRDSRTAGAERLVRAGYDPADVAQAMGLPEMGYVGTGSSTTPDPTTAPRDRVVAQGPRPLPAGRHSHPPVFAQDDRLDPTVKRELDEQLAEVQNQWQYHLGRLVGNWQDITTAQRRELRDQIQRAVDNGDLAALSRLVASSADGEALLTEAMVAIAALSASLAVREAQAQDVDLEPAEPDRRSLGAIAAGVAALLAAGLAAAAGREALRITGPDSSGHDVAEQVDQHLGGLSDRGLRDQLGGALTGAQNRGRIDTFKTAPSVGWYASEVNDGNTCPPCSEVDGRWLGNDEPGLDFVNRAYPSGGYVQCQGGVRCRGTVVAVFRPEQVTEAQ